MKFKKRIKKKRLLHGFMRGNVLIPLLFIVVAFGILLTSGAMVNKSATNPNDSLTSGTDGITCCDTGDGDQCHPQTEEGKIFTYNNADYGLIKSDITLQEGNGHLHDTGQKFGDKPIIESTTDQITYECGKGGQDQVFGKEGCVPIPDNQIMYVCKKNCDNLGSFSNNTDKTKAAEFDAYFRLSDVDSPGIPDVIKSCDKSSLKTSVGSQHIIVEKSTEKENLQLNNFKVVNTPSTDWLSPYCKPAIYLYPQSTIPVNVKIDPVGPIKLTIPLYPSGGWNVVANPTGQLLSKNKIFDYLYYEAEIPDEMIEKPKDGYVIERDKLTRLLEDILPKLGLNTKEESQFIEYWRNALPAAPYYFVGVVPVNNLNSISPLMITPKPKTSIRVTLYFEALKSPISVTPPQLKKVARQGFTMVEWGGIFKKTPDYPFSCFQ
jgi:hypothetical protein